MPPFSDDWNGFEVKICLWSIQGQAGPFPYSRYSGVGTIWMRSELVGAEEGKFCATFPVLTDKPTFPVRLDLERKEAFRQLFYRYRHVRNGNIGEWNVESEATLYGDGFYKFDLHASP